MDRRQKLKAKAPPRPKPAESPRPPDILCGGKYRVPWQDYHGTPPGWSRDVLLATYAGLGGRRDLAGDSASVAPHPFLASAIVVGNIADGIVDGDPACIELAVRYIEQRFIISGSGYMRARMAQRLKRAPLTEGQRQRLVRHVLELLAAGDRCLEFRQYLRLLRRQLTDGEKRAYVAMARAAGGYRAEVADYLEAPDRQPWSRRRR